MEVEHSFSPQDALVAVMVATSASDENFDTKELLFITKILDALPIFEGYDQDRVKTVSQAVFDLFEDEDGIDALMGLVIQALPDRLRETAYALACDISAADGSVPMSEREFLHILRHSLSLGRLVAAAIERGARARFQRNEE